MTLKIARLCLTVYMIIGSVQISWGSENEGTKLICLLVGGGNLGDVEIEQKITFNSDFVMASSHQYLTEYDYDSEVLSGLKAPGWLGFGQHVKDDTISFWIRKRGDTTPTSSVSNVTNYDFQMTTTVNRVTGKGVKKLFHRFAFDGEPPLIYAYKASGDCSVVKNKF